MSLNLPITDWRGKRVWLVGASTGIGSATAVLLHHKGAKVTVSARRAQLLDALATQHPGMQTVALDVNDPVAIDAVAAKLWVSGPLDLVVYCAGMYEPLHGTGLRAEAMDLHMQTNYLGAVRLFAAVLPAMLQAGQGHLSMVASVAGLVGLPKALAYGPTKAALINFAESLYLDVHPRGIGVSLINPGFVDTPLTAQNDFHMPALIRPELAAAEMVSGWERGQFEIHFPRRFTLWLKLLRLLPHPARLRLTRRITGV
jgi:short-subunit dehydrogenase